MPKKEILLTCRITKEQNDFLKRYAEQGGIKESEVIRRIIDNEMGKANRKEFYNRENLFAAKELVSQINNIAIDISSIAYSDSCSQEEKEKLLSSMNEIKNLVKDCSLKITEARG